MNSTYFEDSINPYSLIFKLEFDPTYPECTCFTAADGEQGEKQKEIDRLRNLLEEVVNELDLSESAIEKHGPLGTPPAELVRLVLQEKDKKIRMLKSGYTDLSSSTPSAQGREEKKRKIPDYMVNHIEGVMEDMNQIFPASQHPSGQWVSVSERLPEFDENVLLYYTLPHKDGFYEYFVVGYLNSVSKGANYLIPDFVDVEHNSVKPTHWCKLPSPPSAEETKS